jgi:hypothetical protein
VRLIKTKLLAVGSVISEHGARAANTDQELVANVMGVFTADFGVRDAKD